MTEEILIAVSEFETRVALLRAGVVAEIHLARADGYSLTGNVYLGRVARIIPGMQAAFVDVGLERPGFLHVRDIEGPRLIRGDDAAGDNRSGEAQALDTADTSAAVEEPRATDIRELLHEGQTLMVQIAKDPISGKGARLTTQLAIASRYMVLMPFSDHIGISQRIDEEAERERLKALIDQVRIELGIGMGFIARTAAEGVGRDAVELDLQVLSGIWDRLLEKKRASGCPALVYEELPLHIRMVRDLVGPETDRILIDDEDTFKRVHGFVSEFIPTFAERLIRYAEPRSLFARYGVDEEVSRALDKKVTLKNGGHLVIEQTEAMITVDVNTGGYLGGNSHEETVYRTNLEAAQMIPRQLRLRNLGGIVVIDFIDMVEEEHRRQVMRVLEKACEADPARIRLDGFSSLGLVQLSRKRTRESLLQQVCEPCSQCAGLGLVKTPATTCVEIFRSILEDANLRCEGRKPEGNYLIRTGSEVVDRLLDQDARFLALLAQQIGREIGMQIEPSYGPGEYDVVLVQDMRRPSS